MLDQAADLIGQQRFAMLSRAPELDSLLLVSHAKRSPSRNELRLGLDARAVCTSALNTDWHINQTRIEFHSETQPQLLELLFDLVQ